ncbi:MAG: phosphopantothenoylcysteine synthase [Planctomycetota bacterium]|jgi:phosphopantothenoylcysteine decarboxylase/phosphopantothenate--cysteine ligase|nr:phosphopantothenoylcysteine synthase [Planctomycetota bacterium]
MESVWRNRSVVLGVSGGVAIYKIVGLASKLTRLGAAVDVVMTPAATEFIRPLMFGSITRRRVYLDPWDMSDHRPEHIALAERPVVIVVAPATADTLAKMAHGIADNLLTSVLLATAKPVLVAPAMNTVMWNAPATRGNMALLAGRGVKAIGPVSGNLACGDVGEGRMVEVDAILREMERIILAGES